MELAGHCFFVLCTVLQPQFLWYGISHEVFSVCLFLSSFIYITKYPVFTNHYEGKRNMSSKVQKENSLVDLTKDSS